MLFLNIYILIENKKSKSRTTHSTTNTTPSTTSSTTSSTSYVTPSASHSYIMSVPQPKRNLVMSLSGNVLNLVENYEDQTQTKDPSVTKDPWVTSDPNIIQEEVIYINQPTPKPTPTIFEKLQKAENFVTISKNILGDDFPEIYNITITDNNKSQIIKDLLFKSYKKSINNNNYFDVAAITISLFKYLNYEDWIGKVDSYDENGIPLTIKVSHNSVPLVHYSKIVTPYDILNFCNKSCDEYNIMNIINGSEYETIAKTLYDELIQSDQQIPITIEKFGKLYGLFGIYMLRQKELERPRIGLKQLNLNVI
jgi:hypothetical protein